MNEPYAGKDAGLFLLTLASVPGLGPARINAIITRFGYQPDLLRASADVFLEVPGIGRSLAEEISGFSAAVNDAKRKKLPFGSMRSLIAITPRWSRSSTHVFLPCSKKFMTRPHFCSFAALFPNRNRHR